MNYAELSNLVASWLESIDSYFSILPTDFTLTWSLTVEHSSMIALEFASMPDIFRIPDKLIISNIRQSDTGVTIIFFTPKR